MKSKVEIQVTDFGLDFKFVFEETYAQGAFPDSGKCSLSIRDKSASPRYNKIVSTSFDKEWVRELADDSSTNLTPQMIRIICLNFLKHHLEKHIFQMSQDGAVFARIKKNMDEIREVFANIVEQARAII